MKKSLYERLEAHPELKNHIEDMLDIVEDANGILNKADDAEIKIVENTRKLNLTLLSNWAVNQEYKSSKTWKKANPDAVGHGKKKSIGKQLLVE